MSHPDQASPREAGPDLLDREPLKVLAVCGLATIAIVAGFFAIPGSVFEYPGAIVADWPLTSIYQGRSGQIQVLLAFGGIAAAFAIAVAAAGRLDTQLAFRLVMAVTVALAVLWTVAYPSGSRDIFKNIVDARTLWVHGENPLNTRPDRLEGRDPLHRYTPRGYLDERGYYGPLYYLLSGPGTLAAGDTVVPNLLAQKALNALAIVAMTAAVGVATASFAPGRRIQAMVIAGWNPLVLYEGVANAHNDILMSAIVVVAIIVATRLAVTSSFLVLGASVAVKFVTGLLGPAFALWLWGTTDRRGRLIVLAMVSAGLTASLVLFALDEVDPPLGILNENFEWRTPYSILYHGLLEVVSDDAANITARAICLAIFGLIVAYALTRIDRTPRSLYQACFWLLAGSATFAVAFFWPWYFLWAIPIGAVLAGSKEADLTIAASLAGLMWYAVFPYTPDMGDVYPVVLVFAVPVAYMLMAGRFGLPTTVPGNSRESVAVITASEGTAA